MTYLEPTESDDLDENWRDRLIAVGKALVGTVPLAGGILGELLTAVIPGQRTDRVASYLRQLSERIDQMEDSVQREIASNPAKIELIEEGGYQAARALSNDRISQIVEAVTNGLNSGDADETRRARLIRIFGELDDDEVALLNAYGRNYGNRDGDAWAKANIPGPVSFSAPRQDADDRQLFKAGERHLIRLELLTKRYSVLKDGSRQFDKQANDFKHRIEVSPLGRLLLAEIGMPVPMDPLNN